MTSELGRDAATEADTEAGTDAGDDAGASAESPDAQPGAALPAEEPDEEGAEVDSEQGAWFDGFDPWPGRLAMASSFDGPLPGLDYATVAGRIVAFLVDVLILGFVTSTLGSLVSNPLLRALIDAAGPNAGVEKVPEIGARYLAIVLVGYGIISAAMLTYFLRALRATPGQFLARMRTVNASDGRPIGVAASFFRWLLVFLPLQAALQVATLQSFWEQDNIGQVTPIVFGVVAAWYLILLVAMAVEPRRQGLQDRVTGSVVVELE